jgi:hypothetical protein
MIDLSEAEYQTLLRRDLLTFIHRCYVELHPRTRFQFNWHLDLIAHWLECVRRAA